MAEKQIVKLGEICREVKLTTKNPLSDGYDKYIGLEHLDSGSLKIKRWGDLAEDNPSFNRVFKKGHILFGKRRPYLKKAAIADFNGVCSGDIVVLEVLDEKVLAPLVPYFFYAEKVWNRAVKTSSGSLSPRTKWRELIDLEFNVPNRTEQSRHLEVIKKIEKYIEYLDESIESAINFKSNIINNLGFVEEGLDFK